MMTERQEILVMEYLISQKLPLDILLEIKDHVITQIQDIQLNENLSFESAFSKAKESWKGEFETVNYRMFFPVKIPMIAKRIIKEKYNGFLKKSLLIGLIFFGINLMLVYLSRNQEEYGILFRVLNGMFLLVMGCVWLLNIRIWKYMRTDFKYKGKCFYTMYQQNMGLMITCMIAMVQITGKNGHYAYQFFREHTTSDVFMLLITLIIPFLVQTGCIFALFSFFEHKKTLNRIKSFLESPAEA
ncbi:hypothetical protein [Chryseobacterium sp. 2987]|uniref:hypothetical protein n=1 Tax=Chryseobacterium sp. 2987 TaxID=2817767 RepID=UPI00285B40FE|nr:hypothetical protein [Chryseobacterium sp. 2987]MDR6922227.1 hypothetical protein [Chryseobacterium sp. 2987]